MSGLLNMLLPIIVAALVVPGFELLQKGVTVVDALPAWAKQIIVGAASYGLTVLAGLLGVHLSTNDVTGISSADFSALLSSGLAFVFHLASKQSTAAPAKAG